MTQSVRGEVGAEATVEGMVEEVTMEVVEVVEGEMEAVTVEVEELGIVFLLMERGRKGILVEAQVAALHRDTVHQVEVVAL